MSTQEKVTAEEFWQALMRAYADLFISYDEAEKAYREYLASITEQKP